MTHLGCSSHAREKTVTIAGRRPPLDIAIVSVLCNFEDTKYDTVCELH